MSSNWREPTPPTVATGFPAAPSQNTTDDKLPTVVYTGTAARSAAPYRGRAPYHLSCPSPTVPGEPNTTKHPPYGNQPPIWKGSKRGREEPTPESPYPRRPWKRVRADLEMAQQNPTHREQPASSSLCGHATVHMPNYNAMLASPSQRKDQAPETPPNHILDGYLLNPRLEKLKADDLLEKKARVDTAGCVHPNIKALQDYQLHLKVLSQGNKDAPMQSGAAQPLSSPLSQSTETCGAEDDGQSVSSLLVNTGLGDYSSHFDTSTEGSESCPAYENNSQSRHSSPQPDSDFVSEGQTPYSDDVSESQSPYSSASTESEGSCSGSDTSTETEGSNAGSDASSDISGTSGGSGVSPSRSGKSGKPSPNKDAGTIPSNTQNDTRQPFHSLGFIPPRYRSTLQPGDSLPPSLTVPPAVLPTDPLRPIPSCFLVIHVVFCREKIAFYEDIPQTKPNRNEGCGKHLKGNRHIISLRSLINSRAGLCFIAFRRYSCTHDNSTDGSSAFCVSEGICPLSRRLEVDLKAISKWDPTTLAPSDEREYPSHLCTDSISGAPTGRCHTCKYSYIDGLYNNTFLYHHRAVLQDLVYKSASERYDIATMLWYISNEATFHQDFNQCEEEFKAKVVGPRTFEYLFRPHETLVIPRVDNRGQKEYWGVVLRSVAWPKNSAAVEIQYWCWAYDSVQLRRKTQGIIIPIPRSRISIQDLPIYPLRFAPDNLEEELVLRGNQFWSLRHATQVSYEGWDLTRSTNYVSSRSPQELLVLRMSI